MPVALLILELHGKKTEANIYPILLKKNLTKSAAIWVKKGRRQVFVVPKKLENHSVATVK